MNRAKDIFKVLALAAVTFMCSAFGYLAVSSLHTLQHVNAVLEDVDHTVKRTDLLVKQSSYLVLNAGLTANQLRKASITQTAMLETMNAHIDKTLVDIDHLVITTGQNEAALVNTSNETVKQVQPVLHESQKAVAALTKAIGDVDKVAADPNIPKTIQNVQDATKATASAMSNVSTTTHEFGDAVHQWLHPKWLTSTANWSLKVVHALSPF
jgi:pyruvate kinase